jgi:phosphate:Na+ symporter
MLAWAAKLITPRAKSPDEVHLTYLSSALVNTPPLAIEESKRELMRMSEIVLSMLDQTMELTNKKNKTRQDFYNATQKISDLETQTDSLEHEISTFMVKVMRNSSSGAISEEISEILDIANNLESIGDHCELLMKLQDRLNEHNLDFTDGARLEINARALVTIINQMRSDLRLSHINRLKEGTCDIEQGLVFLDMLSSVEKIGDHAYNIAEAISGV